MRLSISQMPGQRDRPRDSTAERAGSGFLIADSFETDIGRSKSGE